MKRRLKNTLLLATIICSLAACQTNVKPSQSSEQQGQSDNSSMTSSEDISSFENISSSENSSSEASSSSTISSSSESSSSSVASSETSSSSITQSSSSEASSSSAQSSSSEQSSSAAQSSSSEQSSSSSQSSSQEPITNPIEPVYAGRTYGDYAANSAYEISVTPSTGTAKLLVIPVWFTNSSSYIAKNSRELVRSDIEKAYFGANEDTGWRSVKSYYEEESHGKLTITGTVSEWYEDTNKHSYYGSYSRGTERTASLIKKVTDWYFNNHTEDSRTNYDCDGDGFLDGVMVVYGSPDYSVMQSTSDLSNLWAYCYWQEEPTRDVNNPDVNAYFWASFDFMYGSNKVVERTGMSSSRGYASGDTSKIDIDAHTYIHEMGHMFGLEDYYDYSGQYEPAGAFSMQDYAIGGHDPFSSFSLGWGKAYIPTESMTINLKSFVQTGEMIILSPSWNAYDSAFDEYLIIEYYTPDGLNAFDVENDSQGVTGTTTSGIRLWHIDARLAGYKGEDRYGNPQFVALNTTDPRTAQYPVIAMMSNTYSGGGEDSEGYISPLGESYADYNLLQMIRNDSTISHKTKTKLSDRYLFTASQGFSMNGFKSQFVNSTKLNSGKDLGFSFVVNSSTTDSVSITITKA